MTIIMKPQVRAMLDRLIPIEDERCQKNFENMIELKRKKLGEIQVSDTMD